MLAIYSPPIRSLATWRRFDTVGSRSYPLLGFRIRPIYWRPTFSAIGGSAPLENGGSVEDFKAADTASRQLPCPDCRGRGYLPCTECGIDRRRSDCNTCGGEGKTTCPRCRGDCVAWEEFVDEQSQEKARSRFPLKAKEDEVNNLEIKLDTPRKSNHLYKPPSPEVVSNIRQSLKILNKETGLFTKHMKRAHQHPVLRAQRISSIKLAKGSPEARKKMSETMKKHFSDSENRRKISLALKGVKYHCGNCGEEGHRKSLCPILKQERGSFKVTCGVCGIKGHNSRNCPSNTEGSVSSASTCGVCGIKGHNRRSCPSKTEEVKIRCGHCREQGHRKMYCPELRKNLGPVKFKCSLCGGLGHNRRGCPSNTEGNVSSGMTCSVCGIKGHNRRSCPSKTEGNVSCANSLKIRCGHCGELGHRKLYCPELRKNLGPVMFKCGLCGGLGHNRRGCMKSKEEDKKGKDAVDEYSIKSAD